MSELNQKIREFREDIGQSIEGLALLMQMEPEEFARLEEGWIPPDEYCSDSVHSLNGITRISKGLLTILLIQNRRTRILRKSSKYQGRVHQMTLHQHPFPEWFERLEIMPGRI